jgi:ribose-phosphate pyrophosphokinase
MLYGDATRSVNDKLVRLLFFVGALKAVGADHVATLDVHNVAAYENAFRIPADHLEAKNSSPSTLCRCWGRPLPRSYLRTSAA